MLHSPGSQTKLASLLLRSRMRGFKSVHTNFHKPSASSPHPALLQPADRKLAVHPVRIRLQTTFTQSAHKLTCSAGCPHEVGQARGIKGGLECASLLEHLSPQPAHKQLLCRFAMRAVRSPSNCTCCLSEPAPLRPAHSSACWHPNLITMALTVMVK